MQHARLRLIRRCGAIAMAALALAASPTVFAGGTRVCNVQRSRACQQVVVIVQRPQPVFVANQQAPNIDLRHRTLQRSQQIASTARRRAGVIEPPVIQDDSAQIEGNDIVVVSDDRPCFRHRRR